MSGTQIQHYKYQSPPPDGQIPFAIGTLDRPGSPAQQDRPHSHSFFQILFLTGGSGKHFIDFDVYVLAPPVIYLIVPGQVHYYALDTPLNGHVLLFSEDFLLTNPTEQNHQIDFLLDDLRPPVLQLTPDETPIIQTLVDEIHAEYANQGLHRYAALQSYFNIFLVKLQRMLAERGQQDAGNTRHPQLALFK